MNDLVAGVQAADVLIQDSDDPRPGQQFLDVQSNPTPHTLVVHQVPVHVDDDP